MTITIVTTAPSLTVPLSLRDIPSVWAPTLILLGCFVTGLAWSLRANRRWSAAAFVSLFASVLIYAAACGGGSLSVGSGGGGGNPGTPTGTTNAVVVLSSGATTHSFVFTLNVM